ncbi:hypothetical protein PFISCL1PPCAC_24989, partial [Pristionchus fissidentatus]
SDRPLIRANHYQNEEGRTNIYEIERIITLTFFSHTTRTSLSTVRLNIPGGLCSERNVYSDSAFLRSDLFLLMIPI